MTPSPSLPLILAIRLAIGDLSIGQPDIAVNPRNPNNLVFTSTVFSGGGAIAPFAPCFVAYSRNGGKTWTKATWPSTRPACGEAEVTVDARGTFYLCRRECLR